MQKNSKNQNVLKFSKPSGLSHWESALPLGNGKVGALVQGGVRAERIMLCHSNASWKGTVGVLPDVGEKLKEARSFLATRNPVMAGVVLKKAFINKKYEPTPSVNLPVADILIEQTIRGQVKNYSKQLGFETEEACIAFESLNTVYERNSFVSFENDYLFTEISKDGNEPICVSLAVLGHDQADCVFDGKYENDKQNETITLSASLMGYEREVDGMVYGAMSRVMVDSRAVIDLTESRIKIDNAEKVLIVTRVYVGKVKEKLIDKVKTELLNLRLVTYDKAFKSHLGIYSKLYPKAEVVFAKEKDGAVETLIENNSTNLLYEKLFNYGKYLFVSGVSSYTGANYLTGLWGKHYLNSRANLTLSEGVSALYAPAFIFGCEEQVYSMLKYFIKFQDDLKKNANRIYKSKGFMVPESIVAGSALPASIEPCSLSTITSGAVVANLFYDYFLYTKDVKFLKSEAVPFMTNVADFYLNYFQKNNLGELVSAPSFSPSGKSKYYENKEIGVYQNATSDFVVARTLVGNLISIANTYSVNIERIVEYQNFLNALPEIPLEKNCIREFRNEDNSVLSSGMMHLYNVFGTKDVTCCGNALNNAPYINTLEYKMDKCIESQNLIALGQLLDTAVVLGQSEGYREILEFMIKNYLSDNLMFLNSDKFGLLNNSYGNNFFNIAGNMLFCNAMVESMVLSFGNNICLMPAKLHAWKEGGVKNILTRQNVVVDLEFDDKRGNLNVTLKATRQTKFNLILPKFVKKVKNFTIDSTNPRIENITLSAGKSISIDAKY